MARRGGRYRHMSRHLLRRGELERTRNMRGALALQTGRAGFAVRGRSFVGMQRFPRGPLVVHRTRPRTGRSRQLQTGSATCSGLRDTGRIVPSAMPWRQSLGCDSHRGSGPTGDVEFNMWVRSDSRKSRVGLVWSTSRTTGLPRGQEQISVARVAWTRCAKMMAALPRAGPRAPCRRVLRSNLLTAARTAGVRGLRGGTLAVLLRMEPPRGAGRWDTARRSRGSLAVRVALRPPRSREFCLIASSYERRTAWKRRFALDGLVPTRFHLGRWFR